MNWASFPSSNRKDLYQEVEKKKFLKAERVQEKEIISKNMYCLGKVTFLRGTVRVC